MLVLCLGFVAADTLKGRITKIDEKSVTFAAADEKDGKAYDFAKDAKFYQTKKGVKEELKDGPKSEVFSKIGKKGLNATIETNKDGKVTEVVLTGKKAAN
jgi:hypothetical protein